MWAAHCIVKQYEKEIKIKRNKQRGMWVARRVVKQHENEIKINR